MKIFRSKGVVILLGLSSLVVVKSALAQTDPQGMLQIFADASVNWQNAIFPFALNLFKLLAVVDFAWSCITVALEKSDVQSLIATIIKKLMTIGMFYALLVFAPTWFPKIIQSFVQMGGAASGTPTPLDPSGVFRTGTTIAGTLLSAASSTTSLLTSFSTSIALLFAAVVILVAYSAITVHFMLAMIESYLVMGAGDIFLGFGGSRLTAPYAEKYVSQVVSVGARLMVFYLVIGLGQQFATQWIADSQVAATGASANLSLSWTLAAQVAMYAVICWTLPKLVSNVIGGTLSASGGDAIAMGVAAGTAAISGGAMRSGVGAPAAAAGAASAVSSVASAAGAAGASGAASIGAASTAAGAGTLSAGAGGASSLGASSLASAGSASGYTGPGGGGNAAFTSQTGNAVQPAPPSNSANKSLSPTAAPHVAAGQSVVQPPPPARELAAARAANKAHDLIKSVHSSLPHDGAVASRPGLNIGHSAD